MKKYTKKSLAVKIWAPTSLEEQKIDKAAVAAAAPEAVKAMQVHMPTTKVMPRNKREGG